jgi:hypothetical protein
MMKWKCKQNRGFMTANYESKKAIIVIVNSDGFSLSDRGNRNQIHLEWLGYTQDLRLGAVFGGWCGQGKRAYRNKMCTDFLNFPLLNTFTRPE